MKLNKFKCYKPTTTTKVLPSVRLYRWRLACPRFSHFHCQRL